MWVNPKYATEQPAAPVPPEDRGQRLATIARGRDEEFRVNLDSFEGRPYVALRLWARSNDGSWWPTRKGCSVRVRELADVIAALQEAEQLTDEPSEPPSRPARQARPASGGLPHGNQPPGRDDEDFDESGR